MNKTLISLGEKIHDGLRAFAEVCPSEWIYRNLEGGCVVGSYLFWKEAKKRGIEATFMRGCAHCWLESSSYIYDITACQFAYPNLCHLEDMETFPKVRVIPLSEVPELGSNEPMPREDIWSLPRERWGINRYATRNSWHSNSEDNLISLQYWPQGQRVKGYHLSFLEDGRARVF